MDDREVGVLDEGLAQAGVEASTSNGTANRADIAIAEGAMGDSIVDSSGPVSEGGIVVGNGRTAEVGVAIAEVDVGWAGHRSAPDVVAEGSIDQILDRVEWLDKRHVEGVVMVVPSLGLTERTRR